MTAQNTQFKQISETASDILAELEKDYRSVREQAEATERTNTKLSEKLTARQSELQINRQSLNETQQLVGNLQDEIRTLVDTENRQRSELESAQGSIQSLQSIARQKTEAANSLRNRLSEARDEMQKFKLSTSWKLMAPARGLARAIRGGKTATRETTQTQAPVTTAFWKMAVGKDARTGRKFPSAAPLELVAEGGHPISDKENAIAVVIHAYYSDILEEILQALQTSTPEIRLFVTSPRHQATEVSTALSNSSFAFQQFVAENRGRDIAPFVDLLPHLKAQDVDIFLKIHTKGSHHLENGSSWRKHLFEALLENDRMQKALATFRGDRSIGILAPDEHILKLDDYVGSNKTILADLVKRLNLEQTVMKESKFVAGTMFYGRLSVFQILIDAGISANDFDPERGQIDGTLAHAIERVMGILVTNSGMRLAAIGAPSWTPDPLRNGEYQFV
ncbi:MAG: rhamnan synthesis F family protein [Pseudomonadota bacterium]